jgi:hypothetical protein
MGGFVGVTTVGKFQTDTDIFFPYRAPYLYYTKGSEKMQGTLYYTALEVQQLLGVSRAKAYKIVKDLNCELETMGFIVIRGKIPKQFFNEHCYGLAEATETQIQAVKTA